MVNIIKLLTQRVTIGVIILIVHLFLLTNASWLFGSFAAQAVAELTTYMLFTVFAMAAFAAPMPLIGNKVEGFYSFIFSFIATLVVAYYFIVPMLSVSGTLATVIASLGSIQAVLAFGLLFAFVKAFDEEVVFRHILQKVAGLGIYIQAIMFGLFHTAMLFATVYLVSGMAGVIASMGLLTILGIIWGFMSASGKNGLMLALGSHFAWNLTVLGLAASILPGV